MSKALRALAMLPVQTACSAACLAAAAAATVALPGGPSAAAGLRRLLSATSVTTAPRPRLLL